MPRRIAIFVAIAGVLAIVFVGAGFWQLGKLKVRRASNARVLGHLELPEAPFASFSDTSSFRRATLSGTPDYANEIVLTGRARNGSPGVNLITPIRQAIGDSAVLVNRGWVYSPDAATVETRRWHEARTTFRGYVRHLTTGPLRRTPRGPRSLRSLSLDGVRAALPYPVATRYLVSQDTQADTTPARLPSPSLDEGPYLAYAIQWFCFAAIAIGGASVIAFRARLSPESGNRTEVDSESAVDGRR